LDRWIDKGKSLARVAFSSQVLNILDLDIISKLSYSENYIHLSEILRSF